MHGTTCKAFRRNDLFQNLRISCKLSLRRLDEAGGQYEEAIAIRRRLVQEGRGELAHDLAKTIYNLAWARDERGERGLAQAAAGEALEIWRGLVARGWNHVQQYLRAAEALTARLGGP